MGNVSDKNMPRDRNKTGSQDLFPGSPLKDGQAFTFDKKPIAIHSQGSSQEEDNSLSRSMPPGDPELGEFATETRPRANTMSETTTSVAGAFDEDRPTNALPTVFKWEGGGKNVFISGTFSNWKALPMVKSHGDFVTIIDLPEGEHEYKFYVDGEWKHDPRIKNVENFEGQKNNLISVRQSDFEVFQALAKDSEDTGNNEQKEYSQDIPQIKPWEKQSGPPVLPPHLLQVILNKDTPVSCEPTLLPEPNHVMLNHLYALSIKDGVMVLSATHRYRKKYVTTLLYKPI